MSDNGDCILYVVAIHNRLTLNMGRRKSVKDE